MKTQRQPPSPPPSAARLLRCMSLYEEDFLWGADLEEEFRDRAAAEGVKKARLWYRLQVLKSMPSYGRYILFWSMIMLKNYLITALRNIRRRKVHSFLNLSGLTIGLTCFLLISLYVRYEMSYDRFQNGADRIYRVCAEHPFVYNGRNQSAITPAPLAPALKEELPEVETSVRMVDASDVLLAVGEKSFIEEFVLFAGPELFEVFSFSFLEGNPNQALEDPYSIILSRRAARKYFGSGDASVLGKVIRYSASRDLIVRGIIEEMPPNSHFKTDIILPFRLYGIIHNSSLENWGSSGYYTYVKIEEGTDPAETEKKLQGFLARSAPPGTNMEGFRYFLQPLTKIHLHSDLIAEIGANGSIRNVSIFGCIAFLILLIACINYMNLVTARAPRRGREVGIRKVVGAKRGQVIKQFLVETFLMALMAILLAAFLTAILLPPFNVFVGKDITFDPIGQPALILWMAGLLLGISLLAGFYPAWIIGSINPVSGLRGILKRKGRGVSLRNVLVVLQFAISIVLIVCTLTVRNQMNFIKETDVGYQRDQIVTVMIRDPEIRRNLKIIKEELLKDGRIRAASSSSSLPHRISSLHKGKPSGRPDQDYFSIYEVSADYDFLSVFDIPLAAGHGFSRQTSYDSQEGVVINESAARALGYADPLDKEIIFQKHGGGERRCRIIGVMRDFNMLSLYQKIEPLHLTLDPQESQRYLSLKISAEDWEGALSHIRSTMTSTSSVFPFTYRFFDDVFLEAYRNEQRTGVLFNGFALWAIFIACLGLFGLASHSAEQRVKEIGIRKILGASVGSITARMSLEFIRSVLWANLIAWPAAYLIMNGWLRNFAYKTDLGIGIFLLSALFAVGLAQITVFYQALRAAVANPVDALKYE